MSKAAIARHGPHGDHNRVTDREIRGLRRLIQAVSSYELPSRFKGDEKGMFTY
jgi:hypothetical protein